MSPWEAVSAIATVCAAGVGIVTAIIAVISFRQAKALEFQNLRPFIIPSLATESVGEKKTLFLLIRNFGDTPAKNVQLEFVPGQTWNWVKAPNYPFINGNGISAIGPGETLRYFLGEIRPGNPLSDIEYRDIDVTVSFDHPVSDRRIVDQVRMSLQDSRYQSRT